MEHIKPQGGYEIAKHVWHRFEFLREQEHELSRRRQGDPQFSNAVRYGEPPWDKRSTKLRNDEVLPLLEFADHTALLDQAEFCIEPFSQDSVINAVVRVAGEVTNCQSTTAGASWQLSTGRSSQHGHDRHLSDAPMRNGGAIGGWGPIETIAGSICIDESPRTTEELDCASSSGLMQALSRKVKTAVKREADVVCSKVELLVSCADFHQAFSEDQFHHLVNRALENLGPIKFSVVHVFGSKPGYYVCSSGARKAAFAGG